MTGPDTEPQDEEPVEFQVGAAFSPAESEDEDEDLTPGPTLRGKFSL